MRYADKYTPLSAALARVTDRRRAPRISTQVVVRSLLVMTLARLGSLNALEQTRRSAFWRRWLQAALPSADTLGRVAAGLALEPLREALAALYTRLRRSKALAPTTHGLMALVLDGHESHASYRPAGPRASLRQGSAARGVCGAALKRPDRDEACLYRGSGTYRM